MTSTRSGRVGEASARFPACSLGAVDVGWVTPWGAAFFRGKEGGAALVATGGTCRAADASASCAVTCSTSGACSCADS
ncbi:MAG: hypothetical protein ACM3ZE_13670, partial [Myxococcales bacterium]